MEGAIEDPNPEEDEAVVVEGGCPKENEALVVAGGCPKENEAVGATTVDDVTAGVVDVKAAVEEGVPKLKAGAETVPPSFITNAGAADTEGVLSLGFAPKEKLIGVAAGTAVEVTGREVDAVEGAPKLKAGAVVGVAATVLEVETADAGSEKDKGARGALGALVTDAVLTGIPKEGTELAAGALLVVEVVVTVTEAVEPGKLKENLGATAVESAAGTVDKIGVVVPGREKLKTGFGGETEAEAGAALPIEAVVVVSGAGALKLNFGNPGAVTTGTATVATIGVSEVVLIFSKEFGETFSFANGKGTLKPKSEP